MSGAGDEPFIAAVKPLVDHVDLERDPGGTGLQSLAEQGVHGGEHRVGTALRGVAERAHVHGVQLGGLHDLAGHHRVRGRLVQVERLGRELHSQSHALNLTRGTDFAAAPLDSPRTPQAIFR